MEFLRYIVDGYEVLAEYKQVTKSGKIQIVREHYCFTKKVLLSVNNQTVNISLQDWEGNPIDYQPVPVIISGNDIVTQNVICDDGTVELTGSAGSTVKVETKLEGADNASLEVVL